MTENKTAEFVLCVPATVAKDMGLVEGYTPIKDVAPTKVSDLFNPKYGSFQPRSTVETDENFLQLIPYVVFVCGSQVWAYRRLKGEQRLAGKLSVGVGGHINKEDATDRYSAAATKIALNPYFMGMIRELAEEIGPVPDIAKHAIMGFIYDPSNAVGRVHLGVLHVIVLGDLELKAKDPDIEAVGFAFFEDLLKPQTNYDQLENWSKIALDALYPRFVNAECSWDSVLSDCGIPIPAIMMKLKGDNAEEDKQAQSNLRDMIAEDIESKLESSCGYVMKLFQMRDKIMIELYPDSEKSEEVLEADRLTKIAHNHWLGHWHCAEVQPIKSGGIKVSSVSIWSRLDGTGSVIHNDRVSGDDSEILIKLHEIDMANPIDAHGEDTQFVSLFADTEPASEDEKPTTADNSNPTD